MFLLLFYVVAKKITPQRIFEINNEIQYIVFEFRLVAMEQNGAFCL